MSASPPPFEVCYLGPALVRVRNLTELAKRLGLQNDFRQTLKDVQEQLSKDPLGWGDPQYRLRSLDLLVCLTVRNGIQVSYAVDEVRRIVYVRDFKPLPGHPLWED